MPVKPANLLANFASCVVLIQMLTFGLAAAAEPDSRQGVKRQEAPDVVPRVDRSLTAPIADRVVQRDAREVRRLATRHDRLLKRIDALKQEIRTHGRTPQTDRKAKSLLDQLKAQKSAAEELKDKIRSRQAESYDAAADESAGNGDEAKEQHRKALQILIEQQERATQVVQKFTS